MPTPTPRDDARPMTPLSVGQPPCQDPDCIDPAHPVTHHTYCLRHAIEDVEVE